MTLASGNKLAHYEITSKIGRGGMGEVYQAKDQKLGRDVAIKLLPEEFARDVDRVARFQREAKLLASLNHPNIAAIHGMEESDGTHFLVLELVEGDTLADRLKRGSIPVEEALRLALQIAEALEAAHEKGVIHRDLKPANIKVTPDGKVKVLDFGLAKAFAGEQADLSLLDSPTISVAATQKGVILGTAAYMSPEQAKGKSVDKRADIWAFGVVLFEMLTGRLLFTGETASETLASVMKSEPEWDNLPHNLHSRIRLLLERCLEKDLKNRYSGISDARVDIQKVLADPSGLFAQTVTSPKPRKKLRLGIPWVAAAIVLTAIIAGVAVWMLRPTEPKRVIRFDYELPKGQQFSHNSNPILAVSPDGNQLAYSTSEGIYLRSMNEVNAKLIPGTAEKTMAPFFSPNGKWIAYWSMDDHQLKKISIFGGTPRPLCNDLSVAYWDWGIDGNIYYAGTKGIMRVSDSGGVPETLIELKEEEAFFSPQLLPDGKSVMFTIDTGGEYKIAVQSIDSDDREMLHDGHTARYLTTGHLIYMTGNDIKAVPFDIDKLAATGGVVTIVEDIVLYGPPQFYISNSGTFAYLENISTPRSLVWVDLSGKEEILNTLPGIYLTPKTSPDATRIALSILDSTGKRDIGIWNIDREGMNLLPNKEYAIKYYPLWTPDSQFIIYAQARGSNLGIYRMSSDGTGTTESLYTEKGRQIMPTSISRDGAALLCQIQQIGIDIPDIGIWSNEGNPEWRLLLQEDYIETQPQISPDGEWMAYASNESGRTEIYVRSLPEVDKVREQISTKGGDSPLWSPDGTQLYYRNGDQVMAVAVETEPKFEFEKPKILFQSPYYTDPDGAISWDIHPDGKRFLMMKETVAESTEETSRPRIHVVINWFEELKERVPVD